MNCYPQCRQLILLLLLTAGCGETRTLTDEEAQRKLGGYQTIFEAGVRLRVPDGYEENRNRPAFGSYQSKCFVMAQKLDAPFSTDFERHTKTLQENRILGRKTVTIDGKQGVLIHHERAAPDGDPTNIRRYWDLVFGDDDGSWIVSGVYYKHLPPEHGEVLRAAVLSTELDDSPTPKPGERQSFACETPVGMKAVSSVWKELVFTEDGELPTKSPEAPLLRVIEYPAKSEVTNDIVKFAEESVRGAEHFKELEIEATKPIQINRLNGIEMMAKCTVGEGNTPLELYQVILIDGESVIHLLGEVGTNRAAEYTPAFQATAASLKKK